MASPRVLGPRDGSFAILRGSGARLIIEEDDADKRFALVEHQMQPRALAAPMHRHHREDEYSFVLEGTIGALLGDSVVIGNPGDLIFKPREQWHTFWNAGGAPARVLEIISPAGFENYFREATQVAQGLAQELSLWTFQRNLVARRFYEQHGFLLVNETDGACNEENEPDALYTWRYVNGRVSRLNINPVRLRLRGIAINQKCVERLTLRRQWGTLATPWRGEDIGAVIRAAVWTERVVSLAGITPGSSLQAPP